MKRILMVVTCLIACHICLAFIPLKKSYRDAGTGLMASKDSVQGIILFECYMCAEKGRLTFVSRESNVKTESRFQFLTKEAPHVYRHRETLKPGEYNWFYEDEFNMKTKGILNVVAGKTGKIILFENKEE